MSDFTEGEKAAIAAEIAESHQKMSVASTTAVIAILGCSAEDEKKKPRYLRIGALPSVEKSFWWRIWYDASDKEFLCFLSLSRESFKELVDECKEVVESRKIVSRLGGRERQKPLQCHLKKRYMDPYDIMAVGVKYMVSMVEVKDIALQFEMMESGFCQTLYFALEILVEQISAHPKSRVF